MSRLSVIIITKNESRNIAGCLASVAFCDERIVVDGGSTDDTVACAEAAAARVVQNPFKGFGDQKNFALSLASGEWVLSLDADERVSAELAGEIRAAVADENTGIDAYEMPRLSSFLGRPMRHSGWYPDCVLRLFRREKARFSKDLVHEHVVCDGRIGRLRADLIHHPVHQLEDALSRMDRYSTAGAVQLLESGKKISFISGFLHGIFAFLRTYGLRRGFLDGREGFLLAVANAEGTYYRYMKAWLAGRRLPPGRLGPNE